MNYLEFKYLFPPRPEVKFPASGLDNFDNGEWIAQPKLNGSCMVIFTNGIEVQVRERRGGSFTYFKIPDAELIKLHRGTKGNWTVLCGEYLNKNKKHIDGKPFNIKFCIFDILVFDGKYLVGKSTEERMNILEDLYGTEYFDKWLYQINDYCFRVKNFYTDFKSLWNECVLVDILEGWVIKRKIAKLKICSNAGANSRHQMKCRKETKNYSY